MAEIHINDMPNSAFLQISAIVAIVDIPLVELNEMISSGAFPKPYAINNGMPVWLVGDVKGWLVENPINKQVSE